MSSWQHLSAAQWRGHLLDLPLEAQLADGLAVFLGLLGRWSRATNLVGNVDQETLLQCHVLESLAGARWLPEGGRLLDVGSGGGFPGVPLLLAGAGLEGVLLEPRERRWAFLREAVRELGLAVEVRRESVADHGGKGYAVATVRGLAVSEWGGEMRRVLESGGSLLWWRERSAASVLDLAGLEPVLTSPLPVVERGEISVWRQCST